MFSALKSADLIQGKRSALSHVETIIKPLTATPWGTKDFYVEDPDGYIVSFGGRPAAE